MADSLLTYSWWIDAAERAIKTAAQSALAVIGIAAFGPMASAFAVNWRDVAGVALLGAVLSLLTSAASATVSGGTASIAASATANRTTAPPATRNGVDLDRPYDREKGGV